MGSKTAYLIVFLIILVFLVGCSAAGGAAITTPEPSGIAPSAPLNLYTLVPTSDPTGTIMPDAGVLNAGILVITQQPVTPTPTASPTTTIDASATESESHYKVGKEITIDYLRDLEITGSEITFEQELERGSNYTKHLVSYLSEGYKIYGLMTIPAGDPPEGGFKAIVFNHGYIPPADYRTTERYTAYVDYLARSGFVVFKIDYRGHGASEGVPSGSYFSPGYTIDAISALKSLQLMNIIDPQGIGMWGHSMAGNLVLRAMLLEPDIRAGVIWAGAVYSYDDFGRYGIDDNTYRPPEIPEGQGDTDPRRGTREIFDTYGWPDTQVEYWKAVSLVENIEFLNRPLQLHHAEDDTVVNSAYSYELAAALNENGKQYEFYTYEGGGHNLISPYFDQAMLRTVEFFRNNL